jgi:CYTH domain-containing protein
MSVIEIEYEDELTELPEYCREELTAVNKYSNFPLALFDSVKSVLNRMSLKANGT